MFRAGDDVFEIARLGPPDLTGAPDIDQRALGSAGHDHRLVDLHIEPAGDILELVERADIAERAIPEHAMDLLARVTNGGGVAVAGHDEAMARQAREPERLRARATRRHRGNVHIGAIGEVEGQNYSPAFPSNALNSVAIEA